MHLAEKLLVLNRFVFVLGVLVSLGTAGASEPSYFVVRLNDIDQRHIVTDSGATEVTNPDVRADEVLVQATDAQIQKLQSEPAVELIYAASDELARGVPLNACIRAEPLQIGELVARVGEGWTEGRKLSAHLTYSIGFVPTGLGKDRMTAAVQRALTEWSKYVQLDFTYQTQPDASRNLHFLFASKQHGDPYPFDGRGKTLAHTFYPAGVNMEPIAGDLHFDADENWANGVDPDIYSVVLHEIGHALGLGHSNQPGAVMYPYYRSLDKLQGDDVAGIRDLYAARSEAPVPAAAPGVDRAAPTITIKSPGVTISSTSAATIRIAGVASDNVGVTRVTWTASGGRTGTATGTTAWSIPDFALRVGDNTVVIRAYDNAGNTSWRSLTITRK